MWIYVLTLSVNVKLISKPVVHLLISLEYMVKKKCYTIYRNNLSMIHMLPTYCKWKVSVIMNTFQTHTAKLLLHN